MRPRVFPAEDRRHPILRRTRDPASMRPRVFPAEDRPLGLVARDAVGGFNEAAGIPRGRRHSDIFDRDVDQASMRPRVFPAEDKLTALYKVPLLFMLQ